MKIFINLVLIISLIATLPFLLVGEYWGMIWFELHYPLGYLFEKSIGISKESYFLIGLITLIQSCVISYVLVLLIAVFKKKEIIKNT